MLIRALYERAEGLFRGKCSCGQPCWPGTECHCVTTLVNPVRGVCLDPKLARKPWQRSGQPRSALLCVRLREESSRHRRMTARHCQYTRVDWSPVPRLIFAAALVGKGAGDGTRIRLISYWGVLLRV